MIDDTRQNDISWIVDPGSGGYTPEPILAFLQWLEDWDKPCLPSGRYYTLKRMMHFWGGHKFHIGLTCKEHADEFNLRWGGFMSPGKLVDGQFQTDDQNAYFDHSYWKDSYITHATIENIKKE